MANATNRPKRLRRRAFRAGQLRHDISTLIIELKKVEAFVATKPLLTGVIGLVFAVLCFGAKRLIDLYLVKPKTLRQQKTQLQFESYQKILGLLEGFFNDNAKVNTNSSTETLLRSPELSDKRKKKAKTPGGSMRLHCASRSSRRLDDRNRQAQEEIERQKVEFIGSAVGRGFWQKHHCTT